MQPNGAPPAVCCTVAPKITCLMMLGAHCCRGSHPRDSHNAIFVSVPALTTFFKPSRLARCVKLRPLISKVAAAVLRTFAASGGEGRLMLAVVFRRTALGARRCAGSGPPLLLARVQQDSAPSPKRALITSQLLRCNIIRPAIRRICGVGDRLQGWTFWTHPASASVGRSFVQHTLVSTVGDARS